MGDLVGVRRGGEIVQVLKFGVIVEVGVEVARCGGEDVAMRWRSRVVARALAARALGPALEAPAAMHNIHMHTGCTMSCVLCKAIPSGQTAEGSRYGGDLMQEEKGLHFVADAQDQIGRAHV